MTPTWRTLMRELMRLGDARLTRGIPSPDINTMAAARCFDMRAVEGVCASAAADLQRGMMPGVNDPTLAPLHDRFGKVSFTVDLGPRTCFPAPVTWLEFHGFSVLVTNGDPWSPGPPKGFVDGATMLMVVDGSGDWRSARAGCWILMLRDGEVQACGIGALNGVAAERRIERLSMSLAAIAVINSSGFVRNRVEPHRGVVKQLLRAGANLDKSITHTKVALRVSAGDGVSRPGHRHPKAYHFCRAHTRLRTNGKMEHVRAHWRGDPAFGYRLPTYVVANDDRAHVERGNAAVH